MTNRQRGLSRTGHEYRLTPAEHKVLDQAIDRLQLGGKRTPSYRELVATLERLRGMVLAKR